MIQQATQGEQVQYIAFQDLPHQQLSADIIHQLSEYFISKQWRRNFDALTLLRSINKYHGDTLLSQILPKFCTQIIAQIDNLRSNNSKQALTLAAQIIQQRDLSKVEKQVICPLLSALFSKTTSEKSFLKKEAFRAVQKLPKKYNPFFLHEIASQIMSINSQISELGAKILYEYMQNNKITDINGEFLSLLIRTINGKRAFLQKKGKQILNSLKSRIGIEKLFQIIEQARKEEKISEQQYKALIDQMKKEEKQTKATTASLKDYLKNKKKPQDSA